MKRNQAKVKTPAMKEIYEKELAILLSGDNEVPTKEELEELESLLRVDLHRAALERERQRTKEAAGNPALQTMLDMATRYDSVLLAEESYLWQLAWQRYIDCVKASGIAK